LEEEDKAHQLTILLRLVGNFSDRLNMFTEQVHSFVTFSLQLILPHLSSTLLAFPKLCVQFFSVMKTSSYHPQVLINLPYEQFKQLLELLTFGLEFHMVDQTSDSFECLFNILKFCHSVKHGTPSESERQSFITQFGSHPEFFEQIFQLMLQLLLFKDLPSTCIDTASNCLLILIVNEKSIFERLVSNLIQKQTEQIQPHLHQFFVNLTKNINLSSQGTFSQANLQSFQTQVRNFLPLAKRLLFRK